MSVRIAIKKLRMALCLQQQEFATLVGVTRSSMCLYECGKRYPRLPIIRKMLELAKSVDLNLTVEDFLQEDK